MAQTQGRVQAFHLGGGGARGHERSPLRPESRARLMVLEALEFFYALVLSEPYFKRSDTKKIIVNQILGGRLLRPPLDPRLQT